jgi:photosystem II stability/assembly factor-like uncharacterized protein/molybdopterin converting factor small subunit
MAVVVLPTPLQARTGGAERVSVEGATAGEALRALEEHYPNLRGWILDEHGRLRQHVSLFVGDARAQMDRAVTGDEELWVVQAISGGAAEAELLVGTKKGLIVLRGPRGGRLRAVHRAFPGQVVEYAVRDSRSGTCFASVTHGQFGPHLYSSDDPTAEWNDAEGPAFPADTDASVSRIWIVEPGAAEDELWAGVAPAALFHSTDGGASWQLNRGLWDHPTRLQWEGGLGGLCLHSICPWPGDSRRLAVGISAAGVWLTEDGGGSWRRGIDGLVPFYLPEEARPDTLQHCIHKMLRSPIEPETLYMQYHGGVYRSDDAGASWHDIGVISGLPSQFGFPLAIHPRDADRAWVIPLVADVDRVPPEGRMLVWETADRGASWVARGTGLPAEGAYLTVLRQAFCDDGADPLGLYFGTESGTVFGSVDAGVSWYLAAEHLPPIASVQAS